TLRQLVPPGEKLGKVHSLPSMPCPTAQHPLPPRRLRWLGGVGGCLGLLLACTAPLTDDLSLNAELTTGDVLLVDDICEGSTCGGDDKVNLRIVYKTGVSVQ